MSAEGIAAAPPAQVATLAEPAAAPPALAYATAPAHRPGRGAAIAVLLHLAVLGGLLAMLRERTLRPAPEQPVIAMVMENAPEPAAKPVPPVAPAPPLPVPPLPAPPAPASPASVAPVPIAPKAEILALPLPPPPPAPPPPHPRIATPAPRAVTATPEPRAVTAKPAPRAATPVPRAVTATAHNTPHPARTASLLNISTVPAKPDQASNNPPPDYPQAAREQEEQGQVMLSIRVAPNGRPLAVTVTHSTGYKMLDDAARDAVLHWHFDPARKGGEPVTFVLPFWITFRLD